MLITDNLLSVSLFLFSNYDVNVSELTENLEEMLIHSFIVMTVTFNRASVCYPSRTGYVFTNLIEPNIIKLNIRFKNIYPILHLAFLQYK